MFDLKSIKTKATESTKDYILSDEGLKSAIQMAIWLGKPLLLTGAPGTGKTKLAYKLADMLANEANNNKDTIVPFIDKPFVFNTKTTSTATDLFYTYDAIQHFQKKHVEQTKTEEKSVVTMNDEKETSSHTTFNISSVEAVKSSSESFSAHPFIKLNALGQAIVQTYGKSAIGKHDTLYELQFLKDFKKLHSEARSSVVLIDEIDKAPRDFPNDLLNEIENMEFSIKELMNIEVKNQYSNAQVVVIMTSNFEKNLPDAFLRRCLFYHIPPPGHAELVAIVEKRLKSHLLELYPQKDERYATLLGHLPANMDASVQEFEEIKKLIKEKQPATAELLDWIKALEQNNFFNEVVDFKALKPEKKHILLQVLPALAKGDIDQQNVRKRYTK